MNENIGEKILLRIRRQYSSSEVFKSLNKEIDRLCNENSNHVINSRKMLDMISSLNEDNKKLREDLDKKQIQRRIKDAIEPYLNKCNELQNKLNNYEKRDLEKLLNND